MANVNVERYAAQHNISNSEAKRRLCRKGKAKSSTIPVRGVPVPGTGKPKGK